MVHYQCLQCAKQHPYRAPDFCACGSPSFTMIHSADPVLAPGEADAGGANVGPDVTAGAGLVVTRGDVPEPRDFPAGAGLVVSRGDAPEAGDVDSGDAELVDGADVPETNELGGFECSQEGCAKSATHRLTWPGSAEALVCHKHAKAAKREAQAQGHELDYFPL